MRFLIKTLGNMVGIWVAASIIPAVTFRQNEDWRYTVAYLFVIALILTLANQLVRPIIKFVSIPLYILTLGLFSLVINGLMFFLVGWLSGLVNVPLVVDGWFGAIFGGTVTAIISWIVAGIVGVVFPNQSE